MNLKPLLLITAVLIITSCAPLRNTTLGDPQNAQEYGYHPLDPLPVEIKYDSLYNNNIVLRTLPDETMRIAIGQITAEGGIKYGTSNIGYKGNNYIITLDYIKFTTNSIGVTFQDSSYVLNERNPDILVPVYIGIGLRLTANISVNKGTVNLGDLFSIGAAASAEKISGTLIVQTLGISGEGVSATIPFPSEINNNSIQNAILSLGAIKAKIYDPNTSISPRIVGVYNTLGGGSKTINTFISSLLKNTQLLDVTKYEAAYLQNEKN
ncbi:MAG: hypothetical protein K9G70_13895 [Prolixibacteraceae bacterium]|nr:hypothetical protein [Prolixibacteraceae bacterium]